MFITLKSVFSSSTKINLKDTGTSNSLIQFSIHLCTSIIQRLRNHLEEMPSFCKIHEWMWYIIQKCLQSAYFYFFLFYVFVLYIGQILLESIFCRAKSLLSFPWLFPYQWFVVFFLCNCLKYSFFLTVFLLLHLLFHYFELLFSCHIEKIVFFAPVSFPYELFHSLQFVSPYLFSFTFKQFFYYVILSNYSLF